MGSSSSHVQAARRCKVFSLLTGGRGGPRCFTAIRFTSLAASTESSRETYQHRLAIHGSAKPDGFIRRAPCTV